MALKKILFLGSKPIGYDCFNYLISVKEELEIDIAGVLTTSRKEFEGEHDLTALAAAHNIPVLTSPDDIPVCDILYSVQYHRILTAEQIAKATQVAVNMHMAPLPEYRGSNQFSFAIIEGKTDFGTTIHIMDPRIDHGDILFQKRFPIPENCWVDDLYKLTRNASLHLFRQTLKHIVTGQYQPLPQQHLISRYGTSLHMRSEINELRHINLEWPDEKIDRHVRATSMPGFEPPYCIIGGQKVYFCKDWKK